MAKNFNLTVNGVHRHILAPKQITAALTTKRLTPLRQSVAVFWPAILLLSLSGCGGPFSSLDPKGPAAAEVALLWWGMFFVASVVLLALIALWHYAIKRKTDKQPVGATSSWITWGGIVLPTVTIAILLVAGMPVGQRMMPQPDENALQIEVTGHQWYWQVAYPEHEFQMIDVLHIPVKTPVHLLLTSADVIHSFWVPRLAVKLDLLPGRTNVLRIEASEPGIFRGQCAEYCGVGHAHMQFTVIALSQPDFDLWLKQQAQGSQKVEQPPLQELTRDD